MRSVNHLITGVSSWALITSNQQIWWATDARFEPIGLALVCLGSLLPDIDTPQSILGRRNRPLARWLNHHLGHRGLTHSLTLNGLLLWLSSLGHPWLLALMSGVCVHLLMDMMTPRGVPIWANYSRLRIPLVRHPLIEEGLVWSIAVFALYVHL